jgi:septal ring factor EnvC (AmiA/AmiB activator)
LFSADLRAWEAAPATLKPAYADDERITQLEQQLTELRSQIAAIKDELASFRKQFD